MFRGLSNCTISITISYPTCISSSLYGTRQTWIILEKIWDSRNTSNNWSSSSRSSAHERSERALWNWCDACRKWVKRVRRNMRRLITLAKHLLWNLLTHLYMYTPHPVHHAPNIRSLFYASLRFRVNLSLVSLCRSCHNILSCTAHSND